ncbi:MAG: Tol-Pal system beta propeller repeat protein TolB [Pseudomonadota bacterium]|nr:Tol-Pal system beta propeller repeat protein TolB [Pseudomonadota bacterium]
MKNKIHSSPNSILTTLALMLLVVCTTIGLPAHVEARVYLELDSPNLRRIPLAVAPLQPLCGCREDEKTALIGRKILIDDLEFSTFFELLDDPSSYLEKPKSCGLAQGSFDFRNWSLIGAELLIKAGYSLSGEKLLVEFRLYDTLAGKMIVGKRYRGRARNIRLLFHKFTNQVVESVTGLPGEFTSKIAFCGRQNNESAQELYTCDYDGHERRQITRNKSINISPAWSMDANKLVFTSYRRDNPDLYLIDFMKGKETRLTKRKGINAAAAWSADNRHLTLMQRYENHSEITIIKASSGDTILRVTKSSANQASPCWSPDNREIAFVSDRSGTPQIYITTAQGGRWRRLTKNEAYNANPDWSAHNDKIVFTSRIDGIFQICTIKPDGTNRKQLTYARRNCETPGWSPNGRHIIFTEKINGIEQLMVMDDKGRNLKQLTFDKLKKKSPNWSANR